MVDFGMKLKELRQEAGLTQKQLADKLGVTKAMISYYELSDRYPSTDIIVSLADVFHVSTDYLLGVEKKQKTVDVTDLPSEDVKFIESAVNLLRKKNRSKSRDKEQEK